MSHMLHRSKTLGSTNKKRKENKDIDESPIHTTQNSPRAGSNNASYYGSANGITASSSGNIKVVCRLRPLSQRELEIGGAVCVNIEDEKTISIKTSQYMDAGSTFTFDRIFDMESTQEEIYEFSAKPVIESVLEGFNGTVFAYGQTSSGKTYTMMGPDLEEPEYAGIIPRMVTTVFDYISDTPDHIEFTVKVSIVEIYMERIRDLLNPKKINLKVREDKTKGIYIEDVTESYVSDEKDVYDFMKYGNSNRATTTTNMNETSSRSHCIFMMTIHQNNLLEMSAQTGKLYLVDLAGSEKVGKTGAAGQILEEAKEINKSLSALGNVINALTDNKGHQHIPYRDSKLTRILQESLGGNARTSLIINCSPSSFNENETLSALRFGYRAKAIKNTPKINREFTVAQLQMLLEKAERKIVQKNRKIEVLENMLHDNGIALPNEEEYQILSPSGKHSSSHCKSADDDEEGFEGDSDKEDESCSKLEFVSPSKTVKNNQQERIKMLEDELRIERMSLHKQTQRIKILKMDISEVNNRMVMVEKENEAMINKLATQALKMQDLEEKLRDKEMKLEILQLLKDILMTENEELKKSRKNFLPELAEENKEIMRLAQKEGLLSTKKKETNLKEKGLSSARAPDTDRKKDTPFGFVDDTAKDMVKEMVQKLNIKNVQTLKELTSSYMEKLKEGFCIQSELASKKGKGFAEGGNDILKSYEKLREELASEKQRNTQIKTDYEKVIKEYDNLVKNHIPSFEEWKLGIGGGDSFRGEESIDVKDDTLILKEFINKNSKEAKLAMNLEYLKEKKKALKITGMSTDSPGGLEQFVDTPQGPTTSDMTDRRSPMKTQRMINLERQLLETKELVYQDLSSVNQYKNKIESLKSLITNTSIPLPRLDEDSERLENSETFNQRKQIIKLEVLNQVTNNEKVLEEQGELSPGSAAANVKIVKPIKGGQSSQSNQNKKVPTASQKFFDILKQQYRFNRSFMNVGEGILNKQKPSSSTAKTQSEIRFKGA